MLPHRFPAISRFPEHHHPVHGVRRRDQCPFQSDAKDSGSVSCTTLLESAPAAGPHMLARHSVILIGASARAAAWSACRAGFLPIAIDQFADADLQTIANVLPWSTWTAPDASLDGLPRVAVSDHVLAQRPPDSPTARWFGPENWAAARDLSPLQKVGLPWLPSRILMATTPWPEEGTWFVKPIVSGGGHQVFRWTAGMPRPASSGPLLIQAAATGTPCSAIFLASRGQAELIGVTRQLIGQATGALDPYAYHGSIGPIEISATAREVLHRIGNVLAPTQRGLFGVDFQWDGRTLWPVEINPRYTAAVELLEWATRRALFGEHVLACGGEIPPTPPNSLRHTAQTVVGKLILYARNTFHTPDPSRWLRTRHPWSLPFVADLPQASTHFAPGMPLCTVYATGANPVDVELKLKRRADRIRNWWGDSPEHHNGS